MAPHAACTMAVHRAASPSFEADFKLLYYTLLALVLLRDELRVASTAEVDLRRVDGSQRAKTGRTLRCPEERIVQRNPAIFSEENGFALTWAVSYDYKFTIHMDGVWMFSGWQ
ncbi:hypothetical protein [Cupriavidus lacunae]|uniref:hypothetical protein n=1 Tax=Cupriavidus lacunae TaxID=2666307 RepID=UPI001374D774|nr:hypothetical protein [Cupriavidus lacunae]